MFTLLFIQGMNDNGNPMLTFVFNSVIWITFIFFFRVSQVSQTGNERIHIFIYIYKHSRLDRDIRNRLPTAKLSHENYERNKRSGAHLNSFQSRIQKCDSHVNISFKVKLRLFLAKFGLHYFFCKFFISLKLSFECAQYEV